MNPRCRLRAAHEAIEQLRALVGRDLRRAPVFRSCYVLAHDAMAMLVLFRTGVPHVGHGRRSRQPQLHRFPDTRDVASPPSWPDERRDAAGSTTPTASTAASPRYRCAPDCRERRGRSTKRCSASHASRSWASPPSNTVLVEARQAAGDVLQARGFPLRRKGISAAITLLLISPNSLTLQSLPLHFEMLTNILKDSYVKTLDLDRSLYLGHLGCAANRPLAEQPGLSPICLGCGSAA